MYILMATSSHRLNVNVLLNNITFYDFCCFRCMTVWVTACRR